MFDREDEVEKACRTILTAIGLGLASAYAIGTILGGDLDGYTAFWGLAAGVALAILGAFMAMKGALRLSYLVDRLLDFEKHPYLLPVSLLGGIIIMFVPIAAGYQVLHFARTIMK